jgi:hypothetical protein
MKIFFKKNLKNPQSGLALLVPKIKSHITTHFLKKRENSRTSFPGVL